MSAYPLVLYLVPFSRLQGPFVIVCNHFRYESVELQGDGESSNVLFVEPDSISSQENAPRH